MNDALPPRDGLSAPAPLPAPAALLMPDLAPAPLDRAPGQVRAWFDAAADATIPDHDGTLSTARAAATAYAHRAKADNTRRAYRAGVRAWCAWCDRHALPCLPARAADIVAFLAAERGRGLSVNTIDLRRAALRYLHFIAGCPVPTAEAHVAETMAGIHRDAADRGQLPAKKLAATAEILRQLLAPIGDDLVGLRDRALLLVGFAAALPWRRPPLPHPGSARPPSTRAPSRASSKPAPRPPASSGPRSGATASSAARSRPAWTAACIPPASSSSDGTRATPCSTSISNSVTRLKATRSAACCE